MTSTPDQIIELHPDCCKSCGSCLIELPATKEQSRQVIDIPPIKAVYTEYQSFSKVCTCGCQTVADFPNLLRRLNYLNQRYPTSSWGVNFRKLLYKSIALKKKMKTQDYIKCPQRNVIIQELEQQLNYPPDKQHKEHYSFYKRMKRERQTLFVFLFIELKTEF